MTAVDKYLDRYAEAEASLARAMDFRRYDYALVIPAHRESLEDLQCVWRSLTDDFLAIVVVNTASEDDEETGNLLRRLGEIESIEGHGNLRLHRSGPPYPDILVVDRCSPGLLVPGRQGVGLARKIGADIALELIASEIIRMPFIFCTDADVELPPDYFRSLAMNETAAAALYPFTHRPETGLSVPATLYEISMFYYVAGLRSAGSPYAFTTIGSTMAVNKTHYAAVRGFPKRNAAEDFYLLNKLAKTGSIHQRKDPLISIAARRSDRAPFGTGKSLAQAAALADPIAAFLFYDPEIFRQLGVWLSMLNRLAPGEDPRGYLEGSPELIGWCEASGFRQLISRQGDAPGRLTRFVHEWFDGFRTLKFVHFMRDRLYPSVPLEIIAAAGFTPAFDSLDDFRDRLAYQCFDDKHYGLAA